MLAGMYLLVALGITLVYGLTRVANFSHGEMVTLGAFLTYGMHVAGLPFGFALAVSAISVGVASQLLYWSVFAGTVTRHFNGFVVSLGLIIAMQATYALIWPEDSYSISAPFHGVWNIGGIIVERNRGLLVAVCVVVAAVLILALNRTQFGRGIRAMSTDLTAVRVLGAPTAALTAVTFMVGSGLAALAGGILGVVFNFNAYFGSQFLFTAFAIAIVGGLGNITGAIIAAVGLSLSQTLGAAYISLQWSAAANLVAIIVMILVWPQGLRRGTQAVLLLGAAEASITYGSDPVERARKAAAVRGRRLRSALAEYIVPNGCLVALAVIVVVAPWILPSQRLLSTATYGAVLATSAYGVWFLFKHVGIPQIAQFGLMGIGAYAAALSASHWGFNFWLQLLLAVGLASAVAAVMGIVALRTSGAYFLIVLFACAQLIVVVLTNWTSLTNGVNGVIQLDPARPFGDLVDFGNARALYWLVVAMMLVCAAAAVGVSRTQFGQRLVAIRDDPLLAESLGLSTFLHKLGAMAFAGAIASVAGVLYLYQQAAIVPDAFGIFPSAYLLLIMLLGGVGILAGPVIGTIIFVFLPELVDLGPNVVQLVNGLMLITVIVLLPSGVGGAVKQVYYRLVRPRAIEEETSPGAIQEDKSPGAVGTT